MDDAADLIIVEDRKFSSSKLRMKSGDILYRLSKKPGDFSTHAANLLSCKGAESFPKHKLDRMKQTGKGEQNFGERKKISALLLAAAMMIPCAAPAQVYAAEAAQEETTAQDAEVKASKYIFLFIGDGMSYPQIQTTNYYLNAIEDDGDDVLTSESKLNMMKFPVAGSAQTYDSTSFCPDSASTATSISTGHKTYSGTINMDEKMETSYETIAEKLKNSFCIRYKKESFPQ